MKALLLVSLMLYPVQDDGAVTIKASTMQEVIELMETLNQVNRDQDAEIRLLRKVLDLKQTCA